MGYKRQKWDYFANPALFFYIWIMHGGAFCSSNRSTSGSVMPASKLAVATLTLRVLWFAKIPAIRSDFALRAFHTRCVLKGLNARLLAFSRQACLNQS